MRRDYFTLTVEGVSDGGTDGPVVTIVYEGPAQQLQDRLLKGNTLLGAEEIDVAFRLTDDLEDDDPSGVVAMADRMTGEYILELNVEAKDVFAFVEAARDAGGEDGDGRFRIVLETDDGHLATYDKSTLLVYDDDGDLLRGESLLPSGVEL